MVFEHIEKLKRDYTDQYVEVDDSRPELRRFGSSTGQVRTVNMSGRALIEFDADNNIGWYDIDVDYLKVVDKPKPKEPEKKAEKKAAPVKKPAAKPAAAEKQLSPLEMARAMDSGQEAAAPATEKQPSEKKPAGKLSTDDILAAARGKAKGGAAPSGEKSTAGILAASREPSTAALLEAARTPKAEAAAAKPAAKGAPASGKKATEMTLAEKLAAARGDASSGGATAPATKETAEPAAEKPASGGDKPKAGELSIDEILAWCRAHDAG